MIIEAAMQSARDPDRELPVGAIGKAVALTQAQWRFGAIFPANYDANYLDNLKNRPTTEPAIAMIPGTADCSEPPCAMIQNSSKTLGVRVADRLAHRLQGHFLAKCEDASQNSNKRVMILNNLNNF